MKNQHLWFQTSAIPYLLVMASSASAQVHLPIRYGV